MFYYKSEIEVIKKMIERLNENDRGTVIMAPEIGDSSKDSFKTKLRVYSHGGRILDLSTTKRSKCYYMPDKKYIPTGDNTKSGVMCYGDISSDKIEHAISLARGRANVEKSDRDKKSYVERSVETELIYNNRTKNNNGIIIDMEFTCPRRWLDEVAHMRRGKTTKTGKPDLVVYDKRNKSYGIIELKVDNHSCENMEKHFVDFTNMIKSDSASLIKKEFTRKVEYLTHYKIIEPIPSEDLMLAEKNDIWGAFLFVRGEEQRSLQIFNETPVSDTVDKSLFGFSYYKSLDDDIDYCYDSFHHPSK